MPWIGWIIAGGLLLVTVYLWKQGQDRQASDAMALQSMRDQLKDRDADLKELRASAARQLRAAQEESKHAVGDFARALLPMDDALQSAMSAEGDPDTLRQGMGLVLRQLETALTPFGVHPVDVGPGDAFDPHNHECIAEAGGEGMGREVHAVARRGWMLHERLLRPAEVVVIRVPKPEPVQEEPKPEAAPEEFEASAPDVIVSSESEAPADDGSEVEAQVEEEVQAST